ncbi:outer membrane beta-barrel protein [bacterium]|nr:outer membrane beta-barrel protein [bacterium]
MGKRYIAAVVSLLLLATGSLAFGTEFGNIHFGRLYVHPRIGVEATYDDNVFLLGETKEDDVLFKITPGVELDFSREGKSAHLNYLAEIGRYADQSDFNYENHSVDAGVDLQFPSGLMFSVGDLFSKTNDRMTYEWVPLVKRKQNLANVRVGYEFTDRLSFVLGYDNMILDYDDAKYSVYDRDENIGEATIFYRIFNKISLLGEFKYRAIDYDQETVRNDADGVSAQLGITGQLTPKLVALVKGGWSERDYDGPMEDWDGGVFSVDLVHHCTETLLVTLGGSRRAVESTYSTNNYFTTTEVRAGLEKALAPKISLGVSGFYANSDYPEGTLHEGGISERDDDIWGAVVALRYSIQHWLTTSLSYTHEERDSNQDRFDYEDNRVSLGVSAIF